MKLPRITCPNPYRSALDLERFDNGNVDPFPTKSTCPVTRGTSRTRQRCGRPPSTLIIPNQNTRVVPSHQPVSSSLYLGLPAVVVCRNPDRDRSRRKSKPNVDAVSQRPNRGCVCCDPVAWESDLVGRTWRKNGSATRPGRLEAGVQLGQLGLLTRLRRGTDPTDSPDRQPTTNFSVEELQSRGDHGSLSSIIAEWRVPSGGKWNHCGPCGKWALQVLRTPLSLPGLKLCLIERLTR
jgi:hypothetical protein